MTATVDCSGAGPEPNSGWPSHLRRPDMGDKGR